MIIYICMKCITKFKIYWLKFTTWLSTGVSMLVYNFHKIIDGVKTKKNIAYVEKPNKFQKFDVHYTKIDKNLKPIIIYFHGGGWTAYSKHIFTTLTRRLARMGYVVFNCNYSLAPKYKMEDIINDGINAIKYARKIATDFGGDSSKIILAGDSAGAHMSSMITALATNNIEYNELSVNLKALLLFYGVYDLETMLLTGFPKIKTYAEACIEGGIKNKSLLEKYSPIKYNLKGFPPCFIASGAVDKLHDSQSKTMYKVLKENGVKVENLFFPKDEFKAMHAYMIIDGISTNIKTLECVEKFLKGV